MGSLLLSIWTFLLGFMLLIFRIIFIGGGVLLPVPSSLSAPCLPQSCFSFCESFYMFLFLLLCFSPLGPLGCGCPLLPLVPSLFSALSRAPALIRLLGLRMSLLPLSSVFQLLGILFPKVTHSLRHCSFHVIPPSLSLELFDAFFLLFC